MSCIARRRPMPISTVVVDNQRGDTVEVGLIDDGHSGAHITTKLVNGRVCNVVICTGDLTQLVYMLAEMVGREIA